MTLAPSDFTQWALYQAGPIMELVLAVLLIYPAPRALWRESRPWLATVHLVLLCLGSFLALETLFLADLMNRDDRRFGLLIGGLSFLVLWRGGLGPALCRRAYSASLRRNPRADTPISVQAAVLGGSIPRTVSVSKRHSPALGLLLAAIAALHRLRGLPTHVGRIASEALLRDLQSRRAEFQKQPDDPRCIEALFSSLLAYLESCHAFCRHGIHASGDAERLHRLSVFEYVLEAVFSPPLETIPLPELRKSCERIEAMLQKEIATPTSTGDPLDQYEASSEIWLCAALRSFTRPTEGQALRLHAAVYRREQIEEGSFSAPHETVALALLAFVLHERNLDWHALEVLGAVDYLPVERRGEARAPYLLRRIRAHIVARSLQLGLGRGVGPERVEMRQEARDLLKLGGLSLEVGAKVS